MKTWVLTATEQNQCPLTRPGLLLLILFRTSWQPNQTYKVGSRKLIAWLQIDTRKEMAVSSTVQTILKREGWVKTATDAIMPGLYEAFHQIKRSTMSGVRF